MAGRQTQRKRWRENHLRDRAGGRCAAALTWSVSRAGRREAPAARLLLPLGRRDGDCGLPIRLHLIATAEEALDLIQDIASRLDLREPNREEVADFYRRTKTRRAAPTGVGVVRKERCAEPGAVVWEDPENVTNSDGLEACAA